MILLLLALLSYLALALESGGAVWGLPASTMPQFLYLAAAVAVLTCRGAGAIVVAVVIGVLADVVRGGPLGLNVVLLANLTFVMQLARAREWRETLMTAAAFVLVYVAMAGFASEIGRQLLSGRTPELSRIGPVAISRAGGTVVLYLVAVILWIAIVRSSRVIMPRRPLLSDRPKWAQ